MHYFQYCVKDVFFQIVYGFGRCFDFENKLIIGMYYFIFFVSDSCCKNSIHKSVRLCSMVKSPIITSTIKILELQSIFNTTHISVNDEKI